MSPEPQEPSPTDPQAATAALIAAALAEDLGDGGDVTTRLTLGERSPTATARLVAKAPGRLSGVGVAAQVFRTVDGSVSCLAHKEDGDAVAPGDLVLEVRGAARALLEAERTALNLIGRLSGVATQTARFVEAVAGTRAAIVDTRKTTPAQRLLEKQAVLHGGGVNHRIGLYDEVLIKENHFAMAAEEGHAGLVARLRREAPAGMRITAEARDLTEARACADGGADVILLDNFDPAGLAEAVTALADHPRREALALEASGGVDLSTVAAVAASGVDRISIGALTHSAPALDLSLLIEPDGGWGAA